MKRFSDEPSAELLAARLADTLTDSGTLTDPAWRTIFARVPRHVFVPHFARTADSPDGTRYELISSAANHDEWLSTVYQDVTLITQVNDEPVEQRFAKGPGPGRHTSSSTAPGLMARMLEALDVRDGGKVLEIGTGTGLNAAYLSERVGSGNVTTIDIDANLTSRAAASLARLGYHPTVVTCDGRDGYPPNSPYDRVIATCSYQAVPPKWIEQTRPGGKILTNLTGMIGGAMLLITVDDYDGTAHGSFLPGWAAFMPSRHPRPDEADYSKDYSKEETRLDPRILDNQAFAFTAQLYLPDVRRYWAADGDGNTLTGLKAPDGSWAEVHEPPNDSVRYLEQGGPRALWNAVEEAYEFWESSKTPDWTAFSFRATPGRQVVLFGDRAWELPAP